MSIPLEPTKNHNGSFAILPSFVMENENLDEGAKILYARISMYSENGRCWASNSHFADKQKVDIRTIQRWLKQLVDEEYIEVEIERGTFNTRRNIWIIIDFKKNFTKRHECHPPMKSMSPPPDANVIHTMYKQDKEDIYKDNVLEKKTMPRSKDQKGTLDAKRRWKLTQEQVEHFDWLRNEGVDSDDGTLAHWCKSYPFERLYDVLNASKFKKPKSLGAYMQKLLKTDAIIENNTIKSNIAFAEEYKKAHGWGAMKTGKKFVTIPFDPDKMEISLSLECSEFINVIIQKHEIYEGKN